MSERVELFSTAPRRSLEAGSLITIRVGAEVATMTAGEWARLIAKPKRGPAIEVLPTSS